MGWEEEVADEFRDAEEISACVGYFRTIRGGKLVLMGHSTGALYIIPLEEGSYRECTNGWIYHNRLSRCLRISN